jgi:hypothetical protein
MSSRNTSGPSREVDAAGGIGSATGSEGDASAFEVPEEILPFLLGGLTVFGGGP